MSEIVKINEAWNLTPTLAKEMGMTMPQLIKYFKKEYIIPYLTNQIRERGLKGKDRSLARKGFGEIWVDGKRKYINNVTAFFDERASNIGFTDKTKAKERQEVRDKNIYGLSEAGKNQIKMLQEAKVLNEEYETDKNNPNAAKIFHKKMDRLFKKYYRGRIKYDPNKTYGIDDNIDEESLRQWQNDVYQSKTGTPGKDVDHGKMAKYGGTHSLTNLSQQDEFWNRIVKNAKAEFMRTDDVYEDDMVAHSADLALQEHIGFGDNVKLLSDYDEEALTDYHKHITKPGDQIRAEAEILAQEKAYQESINVAAKENKLINTAKYLTEAFGKSELGNYLTGGASGQIVDASRALESLSKGNITEAASNVIPLAINASTTTTISPLKETEKYLKAAQ